MCRAFSTRRAIAGGADPWWRVVRGDNDVGDTGNSMAFVGDGHGGRDSDVDQFRDASQNTRINPGFGHSIFCAEAIVPGLQHALGF